MERIPQAIIGGTIGGLSAAGAVKVVEFLGNTFDPERAHMVANSQELAGFTVIMLVLGALMGGLLGNTGRFDIGPR